jgi:hypothetical protein
MRCELFHVQYFEGIPRHAWRPLASGVVQERGRDTRVSYYKQHRCVRPGAAGPALIIALCENDVGREKNRRTLGARHFVLAATRPYIRGTHSPLI